LGIRDDRKLKPQNKNNLNRRNISIEQVEAQGDQEKNGRGHRAS